MFHTSLSSTSKYCVGESFCEYLSLNFAHRVSIVHVRIKACHDYCTCGPTCLRVISRLHRLSAHTSYACNFTFARVSSSGREVAVNLNVAGAAVARSPLACHTLTGTCTPQRHHQKKKRKVSTQGGPSLPNYSACITNCCQITKITVRDNHITHL